MKRILIRLSPALLVITLLSMNAAIYKEAGGRVVVEAEHFDARTMNLDGHHWQIVPDENGKPDTPADTGFANARGGKYMQSLPDITGGGTNYNSVALVGQDPHLDFKVQISNPGVYRLWMRWGGYDGSSDSIYAQIVELKTPAGPGPDWYRFARSISLEDFDAMANWDGSGAPSTDTANRVSGGGGEVPALWTISTPGTYTLRISQREDGSSLDALMLQLDGMAAPGNPGPPESDTTTSVDTTAPTITDARTAGNPNGVVVAFSEAVSPSTAANKNNYTINNGVTVNSAAIFGNNFTVVLSTTPIAAGQEYTLTVNGVQDTAAAPNTIAPNSQVKFLQTDGVIERRVFFVSGGDIASLTNSAKFTNNQPDQVTYPTLFEGPVNFANNYGTQFRGYITAPASGAYVFFICSDDSSALYLSTDENPAHKHLIATETAWSNSRQWIDTDPGSTSDVASKRSDQFPGSEWPTANAITLQAAKRYYIEALHAEGGGGDNIGVTWQLPGAPEPVDGDSPIEGRYLSAFGLAPGPVSISSQPGSPPVQEPGAVTFTVGAAGSPPFSYQWFRNGTPIPGATGPSYRIALVRMSDNGARFKAQVSNAFSSATSSEATLTVIPDSTPPRPFAVISVDATFKVVTMSFNELMDKASTETAPNYVFSPGNINASSVTLDGTGTNVTITTGSALTLGTNKLAITGVKDIAGNPVAANTTIQFTFNRVTYAANILFDGPLGYYRFEETSGSVATNSGTTGGDGAYYIGDELTAGEGGTPSTPKGDPGPRPPTFAGFDAVNRAATFDGVQDWVDTKNQFLQDRAAFTLEYWVKPTGDRTNSWPTRVGIVGQNDAIEYGFIDPTTIEIWTPGGGSLDTAYPFPDDEWHHVATIADGTSLKTYFDGALAGQGGSATANYGNSTFNVHIGGGGVFDSAGNWFTGQIDEVAIFDKAIPAARVLSHYQAGKLGGVLTTSGEVTPPILTANVSLIVSRSGNTLAISWTSGAVGDILESSPVLPATTWTGIGTNSPVNVTIGTGKLFLRMRRP